MDRFEIRGGVPLEGSVEVSGSKNSLLALMAASLLTEGEGVLDAAPRVRDAETMREILEWLGVDSEWGGDGALHLSAHGPARFEAPYDRVRKMRASFMVLGPLVARWGRARVSLPGGCAIGARPVDQHLKGLEALGAKVELDGGYVDVRAEGLRGGRVVFDLVTVNGTQNVLMAATLARGTTVIENAAIEPEVSELASVLCEMGASIEGIGTERLVVEGVSELHAIHHRVAPDRIEAGTLLVAGAITGGEVEVLGADADQMRALCDKLVEAGVGLEIAPDRIRVRATGELCGVRVVTAPFPGFATDLQAQMMALLCLAKGSSVVTETIFENRFMHVSELSRMGAEIRVDGRTAVIEGRQSLSGAPVMATDLRASACLLLAGLAARGVTQVLRVYHIDRGYERIEQKLAALGGRIRRIRD
ncbi:MAG: UDP-N-acetylglucosamine 1-carboxyvinyltransferase [Myxococcota bacterium]